MEPWISWDRACVGYSSEQEVCQRQWELCSEDLGAVAQLITQELSWCVRAFAECAHKYFCADVSVSCVSRREQGTDVCWISFLCSPSDSFTRWLFEPEHTDQGEATCWGPYINRNKCIFGYLQTCDCLKNEFPRTGKLGYKYNGLCRLLAGDFQSLFSVCLVCIQVQWEEYRAFFCWAGVLRVHWKWIWGTFRHCHKKSIQDLFQY